VVLTEETGTDRGNWYCKRKLVLTEEIGTEEEIGTAKGNWY
jgi:hypothetical protein